MKNRFIPIGKGRAEKLEKPDELEKQNGTGDVIRIMAWVDSPEELELMEKMSDDELEAYLDKKRNGGRE